MDSTRIDFNHIAWDNKSAGMRVKRFLGHGKQMRLVKIEPDSGEADWCDDMLCFGVLVPDKIADRQAGNPGTREIVKTGKNLRGLRVFFVQLRVRNHYI